MRLGLGCDSLALENLKRPPHRKPNRAASTDARARDARCVETAESALETSGAPQRGRGEERCARRAGRDTRCLTSEVVK